MSFRRKSIETFDRLKYAEEHAKRLLDQGHLFSITVQPDVWHPGDDDDDPYDEPYIYDEFTVTDLGPRPKK